MGRLASIKPEWNWYYTFNIKGLIDADVDVDVVLVRRAH